MSIICRFPKASIRTRPVKCRGVLVRLPKAVRNKYILVADEGNHRVVRTNWRGNLWKIEDYSGTPAQQFNAPGGIDYHPREGLIAVSDTQNDQIVLMKLDGSTYTVLAGFISPMGISYDPATEYLYVTDLGNDRIVKTKIDGAGWTTYGVTGHGVGEFDEPTGMYYDAATTDIYVGDTSNYRVVRCRMDGSVWQAVGKTDAHGVPLAGNGNYEFALPRGVFYDPASGLVYCADEGVNDRISCFTMGSAGWQEVSGDGDGDTFDDPYDIFYSPSTGFCYVADRGNNRLVRVKMDGTGWGTLGSMGAGKHQFSTPTALDCDMD